MIQLLTTRCTISSSVEVERAERLGLDCDACSSRWTDLVIRLDHVEAYYRTSTRHEEPATQILTPSDAYECDIAFEEFDALYRQWANNENSSTHTTGVING